MNYKQEIITAVAAQLQSYGYAVYLAKNQQHGFYTNGVRIVCFEYSTQLKFSGCYRSQKDGTGWVMDHNSNGISAERADSFIEANAPRWATRENVAYTTPEQHLKTYGSSSGYTLYVPKESTAT